MFFLDIYCEVKKHIILFKVLELLKVLLQWVAVKPSLLHFLLHHEKPQSRQQLYTDGKKTIGID